MEFRSLEMSTLYNLRMINPIGSMYGIYANIGGILMVNVTIYSIHGSYGNSNGPNVF